MNDYEIRIIDPSGKLALAYSSSYLTDDAAVSAAQKHCRAGELAEVWRADFCVLVPQSTIRRSAAGGH